MLPVIPVLLVYCRHSNIREIALLLAMHNAYSTNKLLA